VLSLLLFTALGILVPLSLLIVIAISLLISVIDYIRYRFSIIMYLFLTSPIPLSKELEGYLYNNKNCPQNLLLIHAICTLKRKYSIRSCRCLALQHCSNNATLHFALLHNALARRRKVIAFKGYCF
jgi:hypothetical protein